MAKRAKTPEMTKGESLTIRLRPKIKYFLELLSRKQHRSISDVIETLVLHASMETFTRDMTVGERIEKVHLFQSLWAPTEAKRLVNLYDNMPDLMTYDDELRWHVIVSIDSLFWCSETEAQDGKEVVVIGEMPPGWKRLHTRRVTGGGEKVYVYLDAVNMDLIEKVWTDIKRAADDEITGRDLKQIIADLLEREPTTTSSLSGPDGH